MAEQLEMQQHFVTFYSPGDPELGPLTGDLVNPDGPEAATALETQAADIARLREALEPFANGAVDVSGAAVIVGYPQCGEAVKQARALLATRTDVR